MISHCGTKLKIMWLCDTFSELKKNSHLNRPGSFFLKSIVKKMNHTDYSSDCIYRRKKLNSAAISTIDWFASNSISFDKNSSNLRFKVFNEYSRIEFRLTFILELNWDSNHQIYNYFSPNLCHKLNITSDDAKPSIWQWIA